MKKILFALLFLFVLKTQTYAAAGDTTIVYTQHDSLVVTNPSTGWNPYPMWATFPSASVNYRKVLLTLKYKCPTANGIGMACGEWDYIDYIIMRRHGSANASSKDLEMARYITSYGNGNNSQWHAEWVLDISEYASLLHDSVEIEYQHTGYETNVSKGWLVTVQFTFIEGIPPCETVSIEQMWKGSMPYGNAANPIENYLQPDTFTVDANTNIVLLKVTQSGHGYDATECAEFCSKTRDVYFDNNLVETKSVWRLCGTNPIYPQGGTWVYDRANWCPGGFVYPDKYTFNVVSGSTHVADIDMQAYTISNPSANYVIDAQKFEFKNPVHANDVSIEEISEPNTIFEFSRQNPVCNDPKIKLRNNGSAPVTSATIQYGIIGFANATYTFTGILDPLQSVSLTLPGIITPQLGNQTFRAYIANVNGVQDEYTYDDTAYTTAIIPPVLDTVFVLRLKTNVNANETSFKFWDASGNIVFQKNAGQLTANTLYKDTLHFPAGCYRFTLYDGGNDGLSWWANSAQGTGYCNLYKYNATGYYKIFNADFGAEVSFNFNVSPGGVISSIENTNNVFSFDVYPNPVQNSFDVNLSFESATDVKLVLVNSMGQVIEVRTFKNFFADMVAYDVSSLNNGIYFLRLETARQSEVRKIVVQK